MLVCVECGEKFEDSRIVVEYFICHECMLELD